MKARFRSLAIAIVVMLLLQATYALGGSCSSLKELDPVELSGECRVEVPDIAFSP